MSWTTWTTWTRGSLAALAACVLLPCAAAGCGTGEAHGRGSTLSPSPVGRILDDTDDAGRHLREVAERDAPEVGVEVTPDSGGGWDVRLAFHRFRCSAPGAGPTAAPGRGLAHLFVDGRRVARLRAPEYHLPGRLVPRGTHHVTARLYADDGTVWAVHGRPVQSTADITASDPAADVRADTAPDADTDGHAGRAPDPASDADAVAAGPSVATPTLVTGE